MTLWIINHYSGSSKHGMEYRHFYLAQELQKKGIDVKIIASSFSHLHANSPKTTDKISYETIDGIDFAWIKTESYQGNGIKRILNMLSFSITLFFKHKQIKFPKPDSILVSSPHPFVFFNGLHLKKKYGAKLLSEVRDIWPLTIIKLSNLTKRNPLVILMAWAEKLAYKKSDYTISLLPTALPHMEPRGLKPERFRYIPNGIQLGYREEELESHIKMKLPVGKFIVGYTGTFGEANALQHFVEAASLLQEYNQIHFLLVGDGFTRQALKDQAKNLNNITFLGRVKKEQVNSILAHFDLCYIGLQKDDLFKFGISPNKIFDYMNAKKPILMAIEAGNDIVSEANCGITIPPECAHKIASAIKQLCYMTPEERITLGNNGHNFLLKNHTYSIIAKKYLELINE